MTVHDLGLIVVRLGAWVLMIASVILAAYMGWLVIVGLIVLGEGPSASNALSIIVPLCAAIALTLSALVGRFISSLGRVAGVAAFVVALVWGIQAVWAWSSPEWALYQARAAAWGESDVHDYEKFPQRLIANGPSAFRFPVSTVPFELKSIEYESSGRMKQASDLPTFLNTTDTTSFIVIKDGRIRYEEYFNGCSRDSIVTSFSIAKSFVSALVGVAIEEGYIGSVDDKVMLYLPELRGRGSTTSRFDTC